LAVSEKQREPIGYRRIVPAGLFITTDVISSKPTRYFLDRILEHPKDS
jgi:hypothetical protein